LRTISPNTNLPYSASFFLSSSHVFVIHHLLARFFLGNRGIREVFARSIVELPIDRDLHQVKKKNTQDAQRQASSKAGHQEGEDLGASHG
jgi:hypothetical protein